MGKITTREINPAEDGLLLYQLKLREADKRELELVHKIPANVALIKSVNTIIGSKRIAFYDGEPFLVYGVEPTPSHDGGLIWGVGTDLISEGHFGITRFGIQIVKDALKKYRKLWNYMDVRNTVHRRFCEATGFTFTGNTIRYEGYTFEHFEQVRR